MPGNVRARCATRPSRDRAVTRPLPDQVMTRAGTSPCRSSAATPEVCRRPMPVPSGRDGFQVIGSRTTPRRPEGRGRAGATRHPPLSGQWTAPLFVPRGGGGPGPRDPRRGGVRPDRSGCFPGPCQDRKRPPGPSGAGPEATPSTTRVQVAGAARCGVFKEQPLPSRPVSRAFRRVRAVQTARRVALSEVDPLCSSASECTVRQSESSPLRNKPRRELGSTSAAWAL